MSATPNYGNILNDFGNSLIRRFQTHDDAITDLDTRLQALEHAKAPDTQAPTALADDWRMIEDEDELEVLEQEECQWPTKLGLYVIEADHDGEFFSGPALLGAAGVFFVVGSSESIEKSEIYVGMRDRLLSWRPAKAILDDDLDQITTAASGTHRYLKDVVERVIRRTRAMSGAIEDTED